MSTATAPRTVSTSTQAWTPARVFLTASAIFHIPLAIVGFIADHAFPIGAGAAASSGDHVLGIFETNGWHNLGALVVGLVSLYFASRPRRAREAALALGVAHVGLFVSLVLFDPSTFWIASNGVDQVVHASTAIGGIGSALLTARR